MLIEGEQIPVSVGAALKTIPSIERQLEEVRGQIAAADSVTTTRPEQL